MDDPRKPFRDVPAEEFDRPVAEAVAGLRGDYRAIFRMMRVVLDTNVIGMRAEGGPLAILRDG